MKIDGKKIVVCGAGGFIGGHLVKRLKARGASEIRAVDIKPVDQWFQRTAGVENLSLDLREKENCFRSAEGIDAVFQLAADMGGMGFIENNRALCMLSVLITTHMLMAAKYYGVKRFFYASSACVYNGDKQVNPDVVALREEDAYPALPEDGWCAKPSRPPATDIIAGCARICRPGRRGNARFNCSILKTKTRIRVAAARLPPRAKNFSRENAS